MSTSGPFLDQPLVLELGQRIGRDHQGPVDVLLQGDARESLLVGAQERRPVVFRRGPGGERQRQGQRGEQRAEPPAPLS